MATLYCGAAKRIITPPADLMSDLRGLMDRHFGGVLDDLYVRVIALKSGEERQLLITFDLDKVPCPGEYLRSLREATGVLEDNILLAAVHTHTAPIAGNRVNEGPNNLLNKPAEVQAATHRYEQFVLDALLSAAREAAGRMVPAKMGVGKGQSYINVDRKQRYEYGEDGTVHGKFGVGAAPESPIDHTVTLVRFEDMNGKPLAFLINYPVHCCVLNAAPAFGNDLGISGDIAGRVCAWNDERNPGAVTLWTSGAAGDINPIFMYQLNFPDPKTGRAAHLNPKGDYYEEMLCLAARHYDDIKRIDREIVCGETEIELGCAVEISETEGNSEPFRIRLHMMRLGETYLLGASGELYDCFAKSVRAVLPVQNLIVVNHDASQLGDGSYIAPDYILSLDHPMLPGMMRPNQRAGLFEPSFLRLSRKMYEALNPKAAEEDPGPHRPGGPVSPSASSERFQKIQTKI